MKQNLPTPYKSILKPLHGDDVHWHFHCINVGSFLCSVCSVKGTPAAQAGFVNELISGTVSSNSCFNVFELLQLLFIILGFSNSLSLVSLCLQEKLEVKGMHQ